MEKKIKIEITDQELSRLKATVYVMIDKMKEEWFEEEEVDLYKDLLFKLKSSLAHETTLMAESVPTGNRRIIFDDCVEGYDDEDDEPDELDILDDDYEEDEEDYGFMHK